MKDGHVIKRNWKEILSRITHIMAIMDFQPRLATISSAIQRAAMPANPIEIDDTIVKAKGG